MSPSRPFPKARKREEYTVYKPKRIKVMLFARKEAAPTAVIAALPFAKRPSMGEGSKVQERPKTMPSIVWRSMASTDLGTGALLCSSVFLFWLFMRSTPSK